MKLDKPDPSELAWIAENVEKARALVAEHGGADDLLRGLDAVWAALAPVARANGGDANSLINAVGLGFGQHLVDTLGLAWTVATDEYGTEMAVHGDPGNVLVFPINFVAKRWQSGEREFFASVGATMVADIKLAREGR
jgi:hypothetical protein